MEQAEMEEKTETVYQDDVEIIDETTEENSESNELENKLKAITEEKDGLQDRLLRLQAEYENYKRRTEKERIAERKYKEQDLATELVPVLDNFERALQTEVTEENQSFKEGIEMVYNQLTTALETEGVKQIEALHATFD